jgi:ABC-type branched-subunit amino acid transport system substrate-binding protein
MVRLRLFFPFLTSSPHPERIQNYLFYQGKGESKIISGISSIPFHRPPPRITHVGCSRVARIHKNRLLGLIFAISLCTLSFLLFPASPRAEVVRIALLTSLPQSGREADYPYLRGAEIAAAEVNSNEGKQGTQFLLFLRRGSFQQRRDLNALRDLFFEQRLHFLFGALPREAILPVARLAHEHQIPFLVFPVDFMESASTGEEPPNLFWISPTPEAYQRAAVRTVAQFPQKRFYLLARNSAIGRNWVKYFWEAMSKQKPDAQRLGETFLPSPIEDYGPFLQTVLSAKTEVCVSYLGVKDWLGFYQTANPRGYFKKVTHFDLEAGNLESLMGMKKKVPEGIWGVSAFPFWNLGWKESKEFVAKYKKNTGSYPSLAALSGYISIYALFEAIKKAGPMDSQKIMGALGDLTFRTPVGQMTIRKTDHRTMWPIWCGSTQSSSHYPFAILGNLKALGPDSFSP